jgi:hypothetical protein
MENEPGQVRGYFSLLIPKALFRLVNSRISDRRHANYSLGSGITRLSEPITSLLRPIPIATQ